jgi:hypothetical protein
MQKLAVSTDENKDLKSKFYQKVLREQKRRVKQCSFCCFGCLGCLFNPAPANSRLSRERFARFVFSLLSVSCYSVLKGYTMLLIRLQRYEKNWNRQMILWEKLPVRFLSPAR